MTVKDDGLGEALHTIWRKGVDSRAAHRIWEEIREMPNEDWDAYLETVRAWFLVPTLRVEYLRGLRDARDAGPEVIDSTGGSFNRGFEEACEAWIDIINTLIEKEERI